MRNLSGHVGVAKLLVENGAGVNAQDKDGSTPLHSVSWDEDKNGKSYKKRKHCNYSSFSQLKAIGYRIIYLEKRLIIFKQNYR